MKYSKIKRLGHIKVFLLLSVISYIVLSSLEHETPMKGNFGRTQFKWAKISHKTETEIFYWSYVLTIWLSGVLNSFPGNKCPTWNVLVLKHIIGRSRGGPHPFPIPSPIILWVKKKKKRIAEGRKAGRVSDTNLSPSTYTLQWYVVFLLLGTKIQELHWIFKHLFV